MNSLNNKLVIMVGNIGSGKSTLSNKLASDFKFAVFNMDSIVEMLGGYEYTRYDKNKTDCYRDIRQFIVRNLLKKEFNCVIDSTNLTKKKRKEFIDIGKSLKVSEIVAYDFGLGCDEYLSRRVNDPKGVDPSTWKSVYERMKNEYEAPTMDEGFTNINKITCGENFKI